MPNDVFADDPEMQELRAKAAAEPDPEEKPIWYQIVLAASMLVGGGFSAVAPILIFSVFDFQVIPFGLFAGGLAAAAVLGWWPGRYRDFHTDEKMTLWKPIKPLYRALIGGGAWVVIIVGVLVAWYDYSQWKEKNAVKNPPAQQAKPPAATPPAKKKLSFLSLTNGGHNATERLCARSRWPCVVQSVSWV